MHTERRRSAAGLDEDGSAPLDRQVGAAMAQSRKKPAGLAIDR
jgi:hypothetical protein